MGGEQKTIIIGLALTVFLGTLVYVYNHIFQTHSIQIERSGDNILSFDKPMPSPPILAHVDGRILRPGIYRLRNGDRVIDAIKQAGGALPDADLASLNLAEKIKDGQKITLPKKLNKVTTAVNPQASFQININSASAGELDKLPGVGPKMAEKIIEYRDRKGRFLAPEDLMKIKGLGKKKFEKLMDKIAL